MLSRNIILPESLLSLFGSLSEFHISLPAFGGLVGLLNGKKQKSIFQGNLCIFFQFLVKIK